MGRMSETAVQVDEREAAWGLCQLAGFAHWPVVTDEKGARLRPDAKDTPVRQALRELQRRHLDGPAPPSAVSAFVEALSVIDEHDAADEFSAWKSGRGGVAGMWLRPDAGRPRAGLRV